MQCKLKKPSPASSWREQNTLNQGGWNVQKFILISTCSGYRNTGLHVFCPQRVGNAMQGGRQLTFIFLCSFSFSLWTKLSATGSIITEDRIELLWLQCFSWFLWRCSDRSLFEKQGKADSSRGPQKIYSNHQGSCHKEGKQGEFLPLHTQLWILEFLSFVCCIAKLFIEVAAAQIIDFLQLYYI